MDIISFNKASTAHKLAEQNQEDLLSKSNILHLHTGIYEPTDATILKDANIGVSVQGYSANTTIAGNTFNGANELVQLNGTGGLPAIDGSLLTGLPSGITDHTQLANIGTNTHAQIDTALTRLVNTSGTNSGDQDLSGYSLTNHNHTGVYELVDATLVRAPSGVLPVLDGSNLTGIVSGVSSVSGTAPVVSSGGATPAISMVAATASVDGYMTSTYASKLDGVETGANNYTLPTSVVHDTESGALHATDALRISGTTLSLYRGDDTFESVTTQDTVYIHPTTDGNLHVPATSTTNEGKVLTAGATAGSIAWEVAPVSLPLQTGNDGKILTTDGVNASWISPPVGSQRVEQNYLATAGQTVFNVDYTVPFVDVWYNGLKLTTNDYTATTGTTVVLNSAASLNDAVNLIGYGTFNVSNVYTIAQSDSALALKANLISPTFTTPNIGTATGTSFNSVTGLSITNPVMNGTVDIGSSTTVAKSDHVHPSDTTLLALDGGTMTGAITSLRETKIAMGANDINLASGNLFTKTISGATTLTVSNVPTTGNVGYMILELTNAGSAAITWFSGVKWAGGTAPTLTAAGKDIISMYSHDGGTVWNVSSIQKDVK